MIIAVVCQTSFQSKLAFISCTRFFSIGLTQDDSLYAYKYWSSKNQWFYQFSYISSKYVQATDSDKYETKGTKNCYKQSGI